MGACTSRSRQNSASSSSDSLRRASGGHKKPASPASATPSSSSTSLSSSSSRRASGDSVSFLKKYSFATLNPAFAGFEQEDEEAMSKLRALAQESFCPVPGKIEEEIIGCRAGEIVEKAMEEHQNPPQGPDRDRRRRSSRHSAEFRSSPVVEETLVMSSSCLPDYSLGIVAVPEPRSSSSSRRSTDLLSRESSLSRRHRHRHRHRHRSTTGRIPF